MMPDIQDHFHFYQLNFLVMVPLVVEQHLMVSNCLVLMEQSFLLVVVVVVVGLVLVVWVCHQVVSRRKMLLVLRLVLKVLVVWLALTLV